ncbi:MAG: hypothetical protein J6P73_06395 [Bacteroidales bacterium]|nr:hypothetical protein [Bacteroidales bacterium]
MKTNLENYEERFVDYMEGQLSPDEMKEVEAFVASHPELEEDFKLFCSSKLKPNDAIVFTKKDSLMKKKTVVIPMFVRVAAIAASIALLIGIGIRSLNLGLGTTHEKEPLIAVLPQRIMTKIEVPQAEIQLKRSPVKASPRPKPVVKADDTPLIAQSEMTPVLPSIKSTSVQLSQYRPDEDMATLKYRAPRGYLIPMEPVDDTESSFYLAALKENLYENAQKASTSLYKKTSKTILTAYYTADCYISETFRDLKDLASR